jgi:hypothetical protein
MSSDRMLPENRHHFARQGRERLVRPAADSCTRASRASACVAFVTPARNGPITLGSAGSRCPPHFPGSGRKPETPTSGHRIGSVATQNPDIALQSVNLMYGATGQILTNTYLGKDAALAEITDVLGLSPQPPTLPARFSTTSALPSVDWERRSKAQAWCSRWRKMSAMF